MNAHIQATEILEAFGVSLNKLYPKKAILVGQKERLDLVKKRLENVRLLINFLDLELYEAKYNDSPLIVGLSGLFAPQASIVLEFCFSLGVDTVIRLGSCGAIKENIDIGDVIIATGAVRKEGTTQAYLPGEVPSVCCPLLFCKIWKAVLQKDLTVHKGIVCSVDAFLRETEEFVSQMKDLNLISVDMITSVFYSLAHVYNAGAISIMVVSDNLSTREKGFLLPKLREAEEKIIDTVLNNL